MTQFNTRLTTPNTFTKGLVMDFNPTVTKNDVLTNALNATLLTFNGNEMQLQQDMGNGRVETAYLPEGYIPVGTCEFGDIIYVVSYNPLENKSQIGCFPSPERNITSDEITDLQQSLQNSDFISGNGNVVATTVKKIIYGNRNMNPGDKYIIYEEGTGNGNLAQNANTLSDYGNTAHTHNTWPKLLKVSVVAIDDSGKITDLNASVKWYKNDYYLTVMSSDAQQQKTDIDSYRSLVTSAYSIFQSKVSGKLAILAELETIDGFSCSYEVFTVPASLKDGTQYTKYQVYFYTSWQTSHNDVNPSGFTFMESKWTDDSYGGYVAVPEETDKGVEIANYNLKIDTPVNITNYYQNNSYVASNVLPYTRLYDLASPPSDYSTYITSESYNAQITDIVNWYKEGDTYAAVETTDIEKLRTVTKVNRLLYMQTTGDNIAGTPYVNDDKKFQYYYNLDSYTVEKTTDGKSTLTGKTKQTDGELVTLKPIELTDDVINNYFHKDTPTLIATLELPTTKTITTADGAETTFDCDIKKLIWEYKVAPAMPYGVLDYLAVSGSIDFSKVGSGQINLDTWKYYNSGNVSTLTWGLKAYPTANKGIAEVVFDFYDNQGYAASYHIEGKSSYSGMFTEQIVLGQQNSSYRLNAVDAYGNNDYIHAGASTSKDDSEGIIFLDVNNKPHLLSEESSYKRPDTEANINHVNDVGTLYANMLYLVRITVKYCNKNLMGEYDTSNTEGYITYYRWYWTNNMFNDQYYSVQDFKVLQPQLTLDFSAQFDTRATDNTNALSPKSYLYQPTGDYQYDDTKNGDTIVKEGIADRQYKTLGAYVYAINQDGGDDAKGNINFKIEPGLSDGFNTFNLSEAELSKIKEITVTMGKSSINRDNESPALQYTDATLTTAYDNIIQPLTAKYLDSHATNGWDYSGYAKYKYGRNNCVVSSTLLGLFKENMAVSSYSAYTKDSIESKSTGDATTEIYSTASAYEAYLDSFSLNLLGASIIEKSIEYVDADGNTVTLDHAVQKANISLKEIRDNGLQLCLTGTTYSKIFAAQSAKDSTAKELVPVVQTAEGAFNSLTSLGLHLYNKHVYFDQCIVWAMGEHGGKDTRCYSSLVTCEADKWYKSHTRILDQCDHNEWRPELSNGEVQGAWKPNVTKPLIGFAIANPGGSNADINNVHSNVSWKSLRSKFGLTNGGNETIYNSRGETPLDTLYNRDERPNCHVIHSFMVYDKVADLATPFADYFISGPTYQYKRGSNSTVTYTLADMLASLFTQLYVQNTESDLNLAVISNIVTCSAYNEYWNKDIYVQIPEVANATSVVTIQTQLADTYYKVLFDNLPEDMKENMTLSIAKSSEDLKYNIDILLYGINRAVTFQYTVPYTLGNLSYLYSQASESSNIISLGIMGSSDTAPATEKFQGSVTANTLYTWSGSTVVPFGQGSVIQFAQSFDTVDGKLVAISSGKAMSTSVLPTLSKVLQYDGGDISWQDLSQFSAYNSKYDIQYDGTGDDPYLRNLPNISIFNQYKPGS